MGSRGAGSGRGIQEKAAMKSLSQKAGGNILQKGDVPMKSGSYDYKGFTLNVEPNQKYIEGRGYVNDLQNSMVRVYDGNNLLGKYVVLNNTASFDSLYNELDKKKKKNK